LAALLAATASRPEASIGDLDLLGEAERRQLQAERRAAPEAPG